MAGEEKTAQNEISLFWNNNNPNSVSDIVFSRGNIDAHVDTTNAVWSFRVTNNFGVNNENILIVERINQSVWKIKTTSHTYRISPQPGTAGDYLMCFEAEMEQIQTIVAASQQIATPANNTQLRF
tara:strand:+ start:451 stop:825 length:375 start_codon:yes stop_codon:yes gene_type:complete